MTLTTGQREREDCAFPPHPSLPGEMPMLVTESAWSRFRGWLRHAPAERLPLPSIPVVWTATEIMHAVGVHGLYVGAATFAGAGFAYGHTARKMARDAGPDAAPNAHPVKTRMLPAEVAAVTAAVGSWVTAGTVLGPLAGPDHLLTLLYAAGSGGGYWWLRKHEAVQAARRRRDEAAAWEARKAAWHRLAPLLGLDGSHLLACNDTLLGDEMLIDTRSTGRRASQISTRDVAERLGEIEMIPMGRIDVTTDRLPGRIWIRVRRKDPWAHPLTHPATHPDSPYAKYVEDPASCRKPLVIGGDPETGQPLRLILWDADEGGKVVMVIGKKGAGKSVLLSCISERVTACPDAQLIQVNLGKHREDLRWKPLSANSALGRDEFGKARRTLQWVVNEIEERSKTGSVSKVEPTPATPLLVIKIDEVDQVSRDPVCKQLLSDIASKCRSEAVALVIAGQRATAQWVGGADLRANVDIAVLGKFGRASEARKATGEDIDLPDMGEYGEGHPGVWLVYELGGGGGYERGRVFKLENPAEIEAIVARRLAARRPYIPRPSLAGLWAQATGMAPAGDSEGASEAGPPAAPAPAGQMIQGTEQITAKIGQARALAAEDPDIPEIPPEMEEHAASMLADRRRQFMDAYTSIDIPPGELATILAMLAAPDGTTSSAVAAATGRSRATAHRYLTRLANAGHAEGHGAGRRGGFHAPASAPAGPPAGPRLHLVEPPQDQAAGDAQ